MPGFFLIIPSLSGPIFQTVAQTGNQYATAVALNGLQQSGEALALYNTVLLQNAEKARDAFDSLSGEVYASMRSALLSDRFPVDGIGQRLDGDAMDRSEGASRWVTGGGTQGELDGNGNASQAKVRRDGLMAGVDRAFGERLTLGFAAGSEDATVRSPSVDSRADIDSTHLGAYADAR